MFWAGLLVLWVSPVRGEPRDEARQLARSGIELLEEGDAEAALERLKKAEALFHAPPHLLYIARAQRKLGRLVAAHQTLVRLIADDPLPNEPQAFAAARREATIEATDLRAKVAVLEFTLGRDVEVEIDGERVASVVLAYPVAVSVGEHRIVAITADGERRTRTVTARAPGERIRVSFEAVREKRSPPPPAAIDKTPRESPFPVIGTTLLAVGGAALVAGAVTGAFTLAEADEIKNQCVDDVCPTPLEAQADDARLLGDVTTGLLVGGGALAAAGLVSLVIEIQVEGSDEQSLRLEVSPTGAQLRGRF